MRPVPNEDPSASSVQLYEHGFAWHVDDEPSNVTVLPTAGEEGLKPNAARGAGGAANKTAVQPIRKTRAHITTQILETRCFRGSTDIEHKLSGWITRISLM
jgi:hypothetical protein